MRVARSYFVAGAMLIAAAGPTAAVDRWETVSVVAPVGDDDSSTINEPKHGAVQVGHDFDSDADQDWIRVHTRGHRSYEARAWSGSVPWRSVACPPSGCARFDMVDNGGTVLVPGASYEVPSGSSTVRWIAGGSPGAEQTTWLRALGDTGLAGHTYDLVFYETTFFLPRFNNTGAQTTVVIVQNTRPRPAAGQVDFFDESGSHLYTSTFSINPYQVRVLVTSSIPALQNASGSATIAHDGGYGALAGKGVALEPTTGFTFDTPLTPLPY
jgi:hypothetical protein